MATGNGQTTATRTPAMGEHTGRQVVTSPGAALGGAKRLPASFDTYRKMRKHPTIALARALSIAPIVAAEWSVEVDEELPDGIDSDVVVAFLQEQFVTIRELLVETALLGGIDFGHQAFEKVFAVEGGRIVLRKLKPLLQDITEILVTETGAFNGLKQKTLTLPVENCLLIPFRVEGTDWYGGPLLENARERWNDWEDANKGAARYDRKVAGAHWVVRYPVGQSRDAHGSMRDNSELAQEILQTLEASGSIALADEVQAFVESMGGAKSQWQIDLLQDSGGRQPTFVDRLRYLDSLMARAMLIPERSVLEGQYGTKAEAGEQIDLALTEADLTHRHVTRLVNWHAVDQVLALNWGDGMRGKARLVAAPIRDAKLQFVREVYAAFLANPNGFLEESGQIDTDAIKDLLGVPKAAEVAQAGEAREGPASEGVDDRDPLAETIRRVYSDATGAPGAAPGGVPADPTAAAAQAGEIQATALNGAQIASIVSVCEQVTAGTLTRPAAKELLAISFPTVDSTRLDRLVDALEVKGADAAIGTTA